MRKLWPFAVVFVYLAFLTHSYFWDGVLFSYEIEKVYAGAQPWTSLPHANHLLYSLFGWVLYAAAQLCRLHIRAITLLQIWNALVSATVAARLYLWVERRTQSAQTAAACTLFVAFGATWWKFSTDADPYIIAVRLLLLSILFVAEENPRLIAGGLCQIGAMLFHELAIFGYVPVVAALAWKRRWAAALAYAASTGVCVVAVYYAMFRAGAGAGHPTLLHWVSHFASDTDVAQRTGNWFVKNAASYGKLLAGGKLSLIGNTFSAVTALSFAVCIAATVWFVVRLRHPKSPAMPVTPYLRFVLWCWFLPYALFLAWFDPGNAAHKLFLWPPLVLLLGTAEWLQRRAPAFIALAIALAAWNFGAFIYPHSRPNGDPLVAFAHQLDRRMPAAATVYYASFSPDDWYLAYFAPGRNWQPASAAAPDQTGACFDTSELRLMTAAQKQNLHVWVMRDRDRLVEVGCH